MSNTPIQFDLPHSLGQAEARRRIENGVGNLKDHIPGGSADVASRWEGDTLHLTIGAMGQSVDAQVAVHDSHVRCHVLLGGMLAMLAGPLEAALKRKGNDLLLEDKRD